MRFTEQEKSLIYKLTVNCELNIWMGIFLVNIVNGDVVYEVHETNVANVKKEIENIVDRSKTYFDYCLTINEMVCMEGLIKKLGIYHFENKLGLTNERYKQMMEVWNNDFETVADIVDDWGEKQCNDGYCIANWNMTDILGIQKIDMVGAFESDIDAGWKAEQDGIPIIPKNELPEDFDMRWNIWIDTPENRRAIEVYCK